MKTEEQEKYISELLGNKKVPKRTRWGRVKNAPTVTKKTDYMRNCIFWIDEYENGRCDSAKLNSALNALQIHLNDLRKQYLTPTP